MQGTPRTLDHDGILTKDEIATYRSAHARKKSAESQ